jgi:hypothetical protein
MKIDSQQLFGCIANCVKATNPPPPHSNAIELLFTSLSLPNTHPSIYLYLSKPTIQQHREPSDT